MLARRGADRLELGPVPDEPALAVLRVLDLDQRGRRVERVVLRVAGGEELVGGEAAVGADLGELHAGVGRRRAGLVPHGVALDAHDDVVARTAVELERELVGHRPGRDEERRLLAEQRGHALLQLEDARVLAVLVVADGSAGDRLAHRLGRAADGVRAEVDHAVQTVSSARGTSVALIGPMARRSAEPGRRSPRPARGSRAGTGRPNSRCPNSAAWTRSARPASGAAEAPAGGDQRGTVPELPAPAPEREPAGRELVQGVGEGEALDGRHAVQG